MFAAWTVITHQPASLRGPGEHGSQVAGRQAARVLEGWFAHNPG